MARNVVDYDYCVVPCVQSLLGVCDEVVIGYATSTDNTTDFLHDFASTDKRIRLECVEADFAVSNGGYKWMMAWINAVREKLRGTFQVQLDCDEVLADWSYKRILSAAENGQSLICKRLNFWGKLDRISPEGTFCGSKVIRAAPQHFELPTDYPVDIPVLQEAVDSDVEIFHYGTLRKPISFLNKSREFHRVLVGNYNSKIDEAFSGDCHWSEKFTFEEPFIKYEGKHPFIAHQWLRERGYDPVP